MEKTSYTYLKNLVLYLNSNEPLLIPPKPGDRLASVSLIFRILSGNRHKIDSKCNMEDIFNDLPNDDFEVELLYIKRAIRPTDRWSGHVAFPGGKREKGETSFETAQRETMEEVQLLSNPDDYIHLGQLDEKKLRFSYKNYFIITPHVFLLRNPEQAISMELSEVSGYRWVNLSYFIKPDCCNKRWKALNLLPAINLPGFMLPEGDGYPDSIQPYHLWGLTYQITCDCMIRMGIQKPGEHDSSIVFLSRILIALFWMLSGPSKKMLALVFLITFVVILINVF